MTEQALDIVDKIVEFYKENAKKHQRLGAMMENIDIEEFKAAVISE